MNLGGGDRRRIGILQGRNCLKDAQNNILRLIGSSLVSLTTEARMQVVVKQFHELTVEELYAILRLRAQVFVVEQDCVYQDLDDIDQEAWHVYIKDNDEVVGCLRVIDKGKRLDEVSIGRVVSLHRKRGIGRALMETGKAVAKEKLGATKIKIGAQIQAQPFYEKAGFVPCSSPYLEDGIPHVYMIYEENNS